VDLGAHGRARVEIHEPNESKKERVILLDTNAVLWLQRNHARARPLRRLGRIYISPANLLEIQFLIESGRLRAHGSASPRDLVSDERWTQDDPPSADWFDIALDIAWTRDTFDRLLVAHARLRRWRLATADSLILEHLEPSEYLEL
jgi:PIN domain nuclease of toxin-antitoxin system